MVSFLISVLLNLIPVYLLAAAPSAGMKLQETESSPQGDIVIEHYFNSESTQREIWLAPVARPSDRVLLYTHWRSAKILFSPDQRWLIINNFPGSSGGEPFLYRLQEGLRYKLVETAQIGEKVWQLIGKQHPVVLTLDFGHRYVEVMRWAADSRAFLVVAFGHLDHPDIRKTLDPWLCVFNLDDLRVSLNLALMNRGALHSKGETAPSGPWK